VQVLLTKVVEAEVELVFQVLLQVLEVIVVVKV
jgi:hypothetical protein